MRLNIIIFIFALFLPCSLIANKIEFTPKEKAWLEKHLVINVSNENDWPPFDYAENGVAKGYSVDLIKILAKNIGIEVNFVQGGWSELLVEFDKKNIDLMHVMTKSKEREEKYSFSGVYMQWRISYFVRDDDKSINSANDLWSGKKIAAGKGWTTTNLLKKLHPKATIYEYENTHEMLEALSSSEVDACIDSVLATTYEMNKNNTSNIKHGGFLDLEKQHLNNFHFVSHKDSPELASIFTKAYDYLSIQENLELQNRWFKTSKEKTLLLSEQEKEYLKKKTEIKMCVDPNWMPLEKIDKNGKYIGILSEYIKLFSSRLDVKFSLQKTTTYKQSREYLKSGRCDIIVADVATELVKEQFLVTKPYFTMPRAFAIHSDTKGVQDFSQIVREGKIGVLLNSPAESILKNTYSNIEIVAFADMSQGLYAVATKQIIAYVGAMSPMAYSIQNNGLLNVNIGGTVNKDKLSVLVNKNSPQLISILDKAIDNLSENDKVEILNKWVKVSYKKGVDYTLVWQIITVFVLLSSIGLYFTFLLRRSNKKLKQTEQQNHYLRERMELAFDGSRDGLWDWNIINDTVYYSPRWKEMLGYKDDELENSFDTWQSRVHPDDLEEALKDIESCIKDKEKIFENKHRLRHKDGHWVWIYDRGKIQRDVEGKAIRMIGTHTDLTTEINLNNELSQLNETLETRVQEQVEELDRRHVFMAQQSRLTEMGEMLSSIAHQWRQPLNRINSNVAALRRILRREPVDQEMLTEQTEMIETNTKYMSDTIEDFSNFFHPEKKETMFSLQNVIVKALELIDQRTKNVEIKITSYKELELFSFEKEYLQVVLIILNNAVDNFELKAIKEPKIDIIMKEHEGMTTLAICDNGGGVAEGELDCIFDPYYSTKFAKEGTGLGLYVAKMMIENSMHGQLQAKNKNGGACFEIITPPLKER